MNALLNLEQYLDKPGSGIVLAVSRQDPATYGERFRVEVVTRMYDEEYGRQSTANTIASALNEVVGQLNEDRPMDDEEFYQLAGRIATGLPVTSRGPQFIEALRRKYPGVEW